MTTEDPGTDQLLTLSLLQWHLELWLHLLCRLSAGTGSARGVASGLPHASASEQARTAMDVMCIPNCCSRLSMCTCMLQSQCPSLVTELGTCKQGRQLIPVDCAFSLSQHGVGQKDRVGSQQGLAVSFAYSYPSVIPMLQ